MGSVSEIAKGRPFRGPTRVLRYGTAVAIVFAAGCGSKAPAASGPPPLSVSTAPVERRTLSTYVTFNGQVTPLYQSTLSTAEAGTVASVDATEGEFVTKGELLATLDTSQLRAQLASNEATAREGSATVYKSEVQAPVASQQYSSAVASARQSLQSANNQVRSAKAAVANDKLTFEADKQLLTSGYVSETTFQAARAAYVAALETQRTSEQTVASARSALQTALTNTNQRLEDQATIAQNGAALDAARANVELLRAQIRQSSIYAPFDGQVTQRLLDPGAYAGANTAILEVSQTSTVYVVANVPDVDLPSVGRGKSVTFTTSSLPGRTFHGTVFDVNTTPTTGTLSYRVRIVQPNADYALRGGMLVLVTALQAQRRDTTSVPLVAVQGTGADATVFTIENGKAKSLPVHVGLQTPQYAEVTGNGISPGTAVIVSQPNGLQDGSPVTVASPSPAPAQR